MGQHVRFRAITRLSRVFNLHVVSFRPLQSRHATPYQSYYRRDGYRGCYAGVLGSGYGVLRDRVVFQTPTGGGPAALAGAFS